MGNPDLGHQLRNSATRRIHDAYPLGIRCGKRGPTRGICDLCYYILNKHIPETLEHICIKCPFSTPVWSGTLRAYLHKQNINTYHMDNDLLLQKYRRLILFGVDTPRPENHTVALILMNATQHHLIERRNNNTRTDIPLNHDTSAIIRKIFKHTCTIAKGLLRNAEKEESRIYRTFNK